MLVRIGVGRCLDRGRVLVVDHLNRSDGVQVVYLYTTAALYRHDALLAVLRVDTWLRVFLEPVVKTGAQDLHVRRSCDHKTPRGCAVRVRRRAFFEVRVTLKVLKFKSDAEGCRRLGGWEIVGALGLNLTSKLCQHYTIQTNVGAVGFKSSRAH